MKVSRWWTIPVVLLVIIILVVIVGPTLVTTDQTAAYLSRRVTEATGADVSLGRVQVRFWPRAHILLGPGNLTGNPAQPAIAEATWRAVDLDLVLGSLLRGRLEVKSLDIHGLDLEGRTRVHRYVLTDTRCQVQDFQLPLVAKPAGETQPSFFHLPFDLTGQSLVFDDMNFQTFRITGVADGEVLRVETFDATLATGTVTGDGTANWARQDSLPVDFKVSFTDVPAPALLVDLAPELGARWEGNVSGEVSGRGLFRDGVAVAESLALEGRITGKDGVIHAGDWLAGISKYLGDRQDLKDIRYTDLDHPFQVRAGRYQIGLNVEGPDTEWAGTGWVGLAGTMDMGLLVTLPAGFTPDLGSWTMLASSLRDKDGRLTLALVISGQTSRPTVALDLQRTLAGPGGDAGSAVRKGLGGLLDKLKTR